MATTATTSTTTKKTTTKKKKKKKKASTPLNGFFHYAEKGGTFKGEICAGISMGFLSVCGMFMNMQLILTMLVSSYSESASSDIATNGEYVAMTWMASMIVAVVGTLLMGLVARLPLVQVTSLSLSTVLVTTVSLNTGLTYYNMLAIVFVSNVIYLIIAAIPQLRRFVYSALPAPVRAALPAAAGLLMALVAAQLTGLFTTSSIIPNYGIDANLGDGYVTTSTLLVGITDFSYTTDTYHPQMLLAAIAVVLTVVIYLLCSNRKSNPVGTALLWGTVIFLILDVLFVCISWTNMSFSLTSLWGRLWIAGAEDAMEFHVSAALSNLAIGKVFTSGFDFSGFTGDVSDLVVIIASTALSYVFLFLYDSDSTLVAVANENGEDAPDADKAGMPLLLNGITNVVAAIIGAAPVAIGKESVAGSKDKARSGLSSVVAAIVFAIDAFVWVVPFFMATLTSYTISYNMYGHYGKVMQLLTETSFGVADTVMMIVGLSMVVKAFANIDVKDSKQSAPFITTVVATFLFSNLAAGVAAGTIAYVLVTLVGPKRAKSEPKESVIKRIGGVPTLVWAIVSCVLLVLIAW